MTKRRKSLDFQAQDVCFGQLRQLTSGREIWMGKESQCQLSRMENLHGLEGSQVPAEKVHSGLGIPVAAGVRWMPRGRVSGRE